MGTATAAHRHGAPGKRGPYAKSSATRERILSAAFSLASEVGIHRASLARIAERAGVAVGNLHYYFGSRAELLRELTQWVTDEMLQSARSATSASDGMLEMEEASIRAYLDFVHLNPAYVRLVEEVRLHYPEIYQSGIALWLAFFRESIERGIASGEVPEMDDVEIATHAHFLLGARYFLDQMVEGVDGRPYPGDEAVVSAYLKLVRSGLTGARR